MSSPLLDSCRACLRAEHGPVWFCGDPGFVDSDISLRLRLEGMMDIIRLWQEADIKGVYWIHWWKPRKGRWCACVFSGWWAVRAEHGVWQWTRLSAENWVSTCLDLRESPLLELCLCRAAATPRLCSQVVVCVGGCSQRQEPETKLFEDKGGQGPSRALSPCPSVVTLSSAFRAVYGKLGSRKILWALKSSEVMEQTTLGDKTAVCVLLKNKLMLLSDRLESHHLTFCILIFYFSHILRSLEVTQRWLFTTLKM